jgi:hypothetical protein
MLAGLRALNGPIDYLGAVPDLFQVLELSVSTINLSTIRSLPHPVPTAEAVSAFVELRLRRPEFDELTEERTRLMAMRERLTNYADLIARLAPLAAWDENVGRKAYEKPRKACLEKFLILSADTLPNTLGSITACIVP